MGSNPSSPRCVYAHQVVLRQRVNKLPYKSLEDLLQNKGVACAKSATAYNNWLTANIKMPDGVQDYDWKKTVPGGLAGLINALDDGTCDALIMESPSAEFMAQSDKYCSAELREKKGSPGLGMLFMVSVLERI